MTGRARRRLDRGTRPAGASPPNAGRKVAMVAILLLVDLDPMALIGDEPTVPVRRDLLAALTIALDQQAPGLLDQARRRRGRRFLRRPQPEGFTP